VFLFGQDNIVPAVKPFPAGEDLIFDVVAPELPSTPVVALFAFSDHPAIPFGTRQIPLAADTLFEKTLASPLLRGVLDDKGYWRLTLLRTLVDRFPLIGVELFGATVFLGDAPRGVIVISNPVRFTMM
jgi:hypothetical protein